MFSFAVAVALNFGRHWLPLKNYTPPNRPAALAGQVPTVIAVNDDCVRGCMSIRSTYVVARTPLPFIREIESEGIEWDPSVKKTDAEIDLRKGWDGMFASPDRHIRVSAIYGRWRERQEERSSSTELVDLNAYTTVSILEQPNLFGPIPSNWPKEARSAARYPKFTPALPFPELRGEPVAVEWMEHSIGESYLLTWLLHEPEDKAYPRLLNQLARTGDWTIRRGDREVTADLKSTLSWSPHFDSKDNPPTFKIRSVFFREVSVPWPKDWSAVTIEIYGPSFYVD